MASKDNGLSLGLEEIAGARVRNEGGRKITDLTFPNGGVIEQPDGMRVTLGPGARLTIIDEQKPVSVDIQTRVREPYPRDWGGGENVLRLTIPHSGTGDPLAILPEPVRAFINERVGVLEKPFSLSSLIRGERTLYYGICGVNNITGVLDALKSLMDSGKLRADEVQETAITDANIGWVPIHRAKSVVRLVNGLKVLW